MSLLCSRVSSTPTPGLMKQTVLHRWFVDFLIVAFGISAWIGVNGIFVQLPLLVTTAPESWGLPAYMVILIQSANLGPILFAVSQRSVPNLLSETTWISGLLVVGTVAMGLLVFLWDTTSVINGSEHSIAMFVLVFLTALVGCSSSVLFMPYLRNFEENRLVSYFIGEGLSGLLPSVVALIQGVDVSTPCVANDTEFTNSTTVLHTSARFSPTEYFIFIFVVLACSTCAFWLLEYLPLVKRQRITSIPVCHQTTLSTASTPTDQGSSKGRCDQNTYEEPSVTLSTTKFINPGNSTADDKPAEICTNKNTTFTTIVTCNEETRSTSMNPVYRIYLCILMGLVCLGGNGFLPAIQSFSCLPYGNIAYHLTVTLAHLANPVACVLALWSGLFGPKGITTFTALAIAGGTYVTYLALSSPTPPWHDSLLGVVLVVSVWIILTGFMSYTKLAITAIFRREPGPRVLFYVGVVTQTSSACGAILAFLLVNYSSLFVPYTKSCPPTSN